MGPVWPVWGTGLTGRAGLRGLNQGLLVKIDRNWFGYWLLIIFINHTCILSCHMHIHTCSSRGGGNCVRGGCGATGTARAGPAGGKAREPGPRPSGPECWAADSRQAPVHILLFQIMTPIYVLITCALSLGTVWNSSCMILRIPWVILVCIGR